MFIDESGANLRMALRYGRGIPRECIGILAAYGRKTNMIMIRAMSIKKLIWLCVGNGRQMENFFLHFIENSLCPIIQ